MRRRKGFVPQIKHNIGALQVLSDQVQAGPRMKSWWFAGGDDGTIKTNMDNSDSKAFVNRVVEGSR